MLYANAVNALCKIEIFLDFSIIFCFSKELQKNHRHLSSDLAKIRQRTHSKGVEKIEGAVGSKSDCALSKGEKMKHLNIHRNGGGSQETSLTIFLCVPRLSIWLSIYYFKISLSYLDLSHGLRSSSNDLSPKEEGNEFPNEKAKGIPMFTFSDNYLVYF